MTKRKVIIKEYRCPKCKGSGKIHDIPGALCTMGISFLFGLPAPEWKEVCPRCKGRGIVERKTIVEYED